MLPSNVALFLPALFAGPLGKLLLALIVLAVIVLVGRVLLSIAWRLITIAAVVIAVLWLVSVVL